VAMEDASRHLLCAMGTKTVMMDRTKKIAVLFGRKHTVVECHK